MSLDFFLLVCLWDCVQCLKRAHPVSQDVLDDAVAEKKARLSDNVSATQAAGVETKISDDVSAAHLSVFCHGSFAGLSCGLTLYR